MSKIDDATREVLRLQAGVLQQQAAAILALIDSDGRTTEFYDLEGYAKRMGLHPSTVRRHLLAGEIPGARKVGSQWRIPLEVSA